MYACFLDKHNETLLVSKFTLMAFSGVEEAAGVLSYLNLNSFFDDFADYLGNCFVANGATCVGGAAIMTEGKLYNIYN